MTALYVGLLWPVVALPVALVVGRTMHRADEQADIVRRAAYPPPVPPSRPRADDSTWLDVWPAADNQPAWDDFDEVMYRWFAEGAK